MRKLLLFILIVGCMAKNFAAQQQYISKPDSLRQIILNTSKEDTTRLSAMKELARIEQNTDKGLELAQELLHEGKRLNLNKYIAFGGYYSLIYYFNRQEVDSVRHYTPIILPAAEKENIWVVYFDALKIQTYAYSFEGNFELAIDYGLKMLNKAREVNFTDGIISANSVIATAYLATERWDEGLKHLEEAYKYLPEARNILVSIDVLGMLISAAFQTEDYPALYQYIQEFQSNLTGYLKVAPLSDSFYSYYAYIEIYSAYYFLRTGQPSEAAKHLEKAKEYLSKSNYNVDKLRYMDAMAEYHQTFNQYDKAISYLDTTLIALKDIYLIDYYKELVKKADIYVKMGEHDKALSLYQEAVNGKDSINQAVSNKQMEQIQQIYNIDRYQLEKEQLRNERRTIYLFLIILGIIILITFIVRIVFVKRRLRKAEKEIRKATLIANEANEIKELFLSNMSYNIRTPLNNVVGFSQLLSMEPDMDEEQRKDYASIIKKNSEELMNLVNNILDLSRLEAGMMKFNMSKSEIGSICNDAIYTANQQNKGIIEFYSDIQTPTAEIYTDYSRFLMVLSSTLTYPVNCEVKREVSIRIENNNKELRFIISNSPLAEPSFTTQEVTIRNEINRLFIEHFGGWYRINPENYSPNTIVFTYPLSIS